jgi:hypothetical protein
MEVHVKAPLRHATLTIATLLFAAFTVRADDHIVPLSELHQAISQANMQRDGNREAIDHFFSQARVQAALSDVGINSGQVKLRASLLSDAEQARLAAKVRAADAQISGGELKDSQVTLIILAVTLFAVLAVLVVAFH